MMKAHVVIVGGGVGGTIVANRLALTAPEDATITLLNTGEKHVYQGGWLYLPLEETPSEALERPLPTLLHDRVQFVPKPVTALDFDRRTVHTDEMTLTYDFLIIATGCQPDPAEITGLAENAHHFHSAEGAMKLREALATFEGGRIVVGVGGLPYKCPPSPIEFVCLLHDYLTRKGLREKTELVYVTPLPRIFHLDPLVPIFEERFHRFRIQFLPFFTLERIEGEKKAVSLDGQEVTADLFVLTPPHVGAQCVQKTGVGDEKGYVPTDRFTLKVEGLEGVYALGDATDLPTPKSAVAAQKQAYIVAENILAELAGQKLRRYNGQVGCVIELGAEEATVATFDYDNPPVPPKPNPQISRQKRRYVDIYWDAVLPAIT